MYLGNSPVENTVIRLEARKSFELGVWLTDTNERPLEIFDTSLRLVVKSLPLDQSDTSDATNLITNDEAQLVRPEVGYARFTLQASDTDHAPGEYPFAIVLLHEGYSSVIVSGILEILTNTEFASVGEVYDPGNPPTSLVVALRERNAITVRTGPVLAPGTTSFTDGDKSKLDSIEPGAQLNTPADWLALPGNPGHILNRPPSVGIPVGGSPGEALIKQSSLDGDAIWANIGSGGGGSGLDATGVSDGLVPTANGLDSWAWAPPPVLSVAGRGGDIVLNLDDVADSSARLAMTPTERTKLGTLTATPAWSSITGKPSFGTMALETATNYIQKAGINATTDFASGTVPAARLPKLSGLDGITDGTAPPTGGADGDYYFQYSI